NGSLLRKYTYMSNNSSYTVSLEDDVEILLLENFPSNIDKANPDCLEELSCSSNTSLCGNDSFKMESFTFEAQVICDHVTGKSKGYGFVKFTSENAASAAMREMDGQLLDGRNIRIQFAHKGSLAIRPYMFHQLFSLNLDSRPAPYVVNESAPRPYKFRLYLKRLSGVAQQQDVIPSSYCSGPAEQNAKLCSLGIFDIQALAASGQIPPQTLAALHAELLGRPTGSIVFPAMDQPLLQSSIQGPKGIPANHGLARVCCIWGQIFLFK
ncbi:hypothetical protein U1Q18_024571, partial [Sarracenia purpurea var. burkii]